MNEYYTAPADVGAGNRGKSAKINEMIQAVEDAFDALPVGLTSTTAEVVAARDGETDLLAKQNAQDALISALEAAGGVLASFLNSSYLEGAGIDMTDNGDDTLTIVARPYTHIFMMGF